MNEKLHENNRKMNRVTKFWIEVSREVVYCLVVVVDVKDVTVVADVVVDLVDWVFGFRVVCDDELTTTAAFVRRTGSSSSIVSSNQFIIVICLKNSTMKFETLRWRMLIN